LLFVDCRHSQHPSVKSMAADEAEVVRGALRAALDGHSAWHAGLTPGYRALARSVMHRLDRALSVAEPEVDSEVLWVEGER
jgi:hypothetical protein